MTGLRRHAHVTPARRQLGWLTTEMRRMYFSAITIYKARRFGQPKYLAELFETRRRIDLGRGDAIPELKLCSSSSEAGKKSIKYECAKFGVNRYTIQREIPGTDFAYINAGNTSVRQALKGDLWSHTNLPSIVKIHFLS